MPAITGSQRKIQYPLNLTLDMESITDVAIIAHPTLEQWDAIDDDEKIDIILNLSLNEYLALANAIDVGRDIAYGDNSLEIWWVWIRSLKSMDICASVLECIENDSAVQSAIVDVVANSDANQMIGVGQNQSNLILGLDNNPTCDLDMLWGGVDSLINSANTNNVDSLEILEVLTNVNEWITQIMVGVLGVEPPVIESALEWGLFIQDNIMENYAAQVTAAYLNEIKCGLFCIARIKNCELTPQDIVNYFFSRLSSVLSYQSLLEDSLQFVFTGLWVGTEIADVMFLSQFAFRAQFGAFHGSLGFATIDLAMRLGYDNPSTDWTLLCPCVTPFDYTFDFTVDNGSWVADLRDGSGWNASWNATQGWFDSLSLSITRDIDVGTAFNCILVECIGEPNTDVSIGWFTQAGYPNSVDYVTVSLDGDGIGSEVVDWDVLSTYRPYLGRIGTASYRECTYISYSGFES